MLECSLRNLGSARGKLEIVADGSALCYSSRKTGLGGSRLACVIWHGMLWYGQVLDLLVVSWHLSFRLMCNDGGGMDFGENEGAAVG